MWGYPTLLNLLQKILRKDKTFDSKKEIMTESFEKTFFKDPLTTNNAMQYTVTR